MPDYKIEISKDSIFEFIKLQTDFSKRLDSLINLEDKIADNKIKNRLHNIYEHLEQFGQGVLHFTIDNFPQEFVSSEWKLKLINKYLDRQGFPE